jgi:hypothetical protein
MAKKAKAVKDVQVAQAIPDAERLGSSDLVRQWAEDHACDRFTMREVDKDKFRVNLYTESGDTIRVSHLSRSFYLVVTDGVIEDKTIKRTG